MKRVLLSLALLALSRPASAQTVTVALQGYYTTSPNGNDSTYLQAFTTARRGGGPLTFLFLAHTGDIIELAPPAALGQAASTVLNRWTLPAGVMAGHNGISYDNGKDRLYVTSGDDYTVDTNPGRVFEFALGPGGSVKQVKTWTFSNVVAKRVWGSIQPVPAALQAAYGGAYAAIGGGYTSLLAQGGAASLGPAVYAFPDPDTIANGAKVKAHVVLDASASRGARLTVPQNYFDGGDVRQNPSTRPTVPPASNGAWRSPRGDGLGSMVWGDASYSSGFFIGNTLAELWSLCKGACWYQTSTLVFDDRQYQLHQWASAPSSLLQKPDTMTELVLPRGAGMSPTPPANPDPWQGNTPTGNINGTSYDAQTATMFAAGCPLGDDVFTCRIYAFAVKGAGASAPTPTARGTTER